MRSPSGSQRRQQKRQGPSSSNPGVGTNSNSNASVVPSDACSPSDDSRAQNVVDEFFQPVKVKYFYRFPLLDALELKQCMNAFGFNVRQVRMNLIALCVIGNSKLAFSLTFSANLGADS